MIINSEVTKFLNNIDNKTLSENLTETLTWVNNNYIDLKLEYKWNQPMFTMNGTYIIGLSASKNHYSVGLETIIMDHFKDKIINRDYKTGKKIFQVPFDGKIDYDLLKEIIDYTIIEKTNVKSFWF